MSTTSGPAVPSATTIGRLKPLSGKGFALSPGFWGDRQLLVAERGLPHALAELERTGRLRNASASSLSGEVPYSGDTYADSDVYKTLEALIWRLSRWPDPLLSTAVSSIASDLSAAQDQDGYLHTWFQRPDAPDRWSDPRMGHELYCAGHLIQAAVAEHRTGASYGLMPLAIRCADHLLERFRDPTVPVLCGHPLIEMALVELFRVTGNADYRDLASRMVDARGFGSLGPGLFGSQYYQDVVPVRSATTLVGHCVRALYLACGVTDLYLETGERALLDAMVAQWEGTLSTKTYITAGVGCRRKDEAFGAPFELPPDHAFAETCAGVALFQWGWRMLLATGDAGYADVMERLLFNLLPAGMAQDGLSFSYINTLHRRRDSPEFGDKTTLRQPWFRCPCCPPNLMRLIASIGGYLATQDNEGVQLHQYVGGSVAATLPEGDLGLEVRSNYPYSGEVEVTVTETPADPWTLSLRIPGWCEQSTASVQGEPVPTRSDGGYLLLRRAWTRGDVVRLELMMPPRMSAADERIDAVRGCLVVEQGPRIFCLEEADLAEGTLEAVLLDPAVVLRSSGNDVVHAGGVRVDEPGDGWPYRTAGKPEPGHQVREELLLRPYHSWGNRGDGGMRVWLPVAQG